MMTIRWVILFGINLVLRTLDFANEPQQCNFSIDATNHAKVLFDTALPDLKDKNTTIIGLDIVVCQKVTDQHWDSVECPLGKLRYMSWKITTNIHHTTSHDPDTRLQLVMIKDLPYERLADSDLDHAHHTGLERR